MPPKKAAKPAKSKSKKGRVKRPARRAKADAPPPKRSRRVIARRSPADLPLPVESAPDILPLADPAFDWRRFERFCRALVSRLPGVITCVHYGRPGNKQRGIDLVATMADRSERTYQCRQWKRFSGADVRKTIRETTYSGVQHIILTSAEADASARDEIGKHAPKWELWDIADISLKVRELAPQHAHDIVTVCFGAPWCRSFLRMGPLVALLSSEVSLAPYLDAKRVFNHAHALVGRQPTLQRLVDFAGAPTQRVAIAAGAGGTGKTRLLLELDRRLRHDMPPLQVRRAEEGIPITDDVVAQIPVSECLLIIDDAHRRDDLGWLLAILRQRPKLKLLFSTRPHAVERLQNEILFAKLADGEVAEPIVVNKLTYEETLTLIRPILGSRATPGQIDARIARIADGSPLVATVAAALVRDGNLAPELIQEDARFAQEVFQRFRDAVLGEFTDDPEERRIAKALLPLVAALAPLPLTDDALFDAIAGHVEVAPSVIRRTLAELENAGILVRQTDSRGGAVRITPDVLADHILVLHSLMPNGEATGYARELVKAFGAARMPALLRNFAELDWRVRQMRENAQSGVDEIWQAFEGQFAGTDVEARDTLLEILEDVAYYQPARALALARPLVLGHDPSSTIGANKAERYARILQRVGYTVNHLRDCVDLLLRVAGSEESTTPERGANHALTELTSYDLHKPFVVQRIVIDVVEDWLSRDVTFLERAANTVRPLLAKTGTNTTSDKRHLYFRHFTVPAPAVSALRIRARRILETALSSGRPTLVHRTLAVLCEDVAEPLPNFGQELSESDRAAWLPERLATLEVIERAMRATSDPVIRLAVRDRLVWHARHGTGPIHERVKALLEA
ncbi:MAG: hypothetical protein M3O36_06665, partial [Myxococcota bacterium]|nr:hypothetical protein [Myxococcota bacterium]